MSWTDERVELLKKLWADGLSASQIAAELGGGVTRNAVIGKVHRLGLSGRAKANAVTSNRTRRAAQPTRAAARPVAAQPVVRGNVALAVVPVAYAEQVLEAVAETEVVVALSRRVSILELRDTMCRWPLGDPLTAEFAFCGADCDVSKPYCNHHAGVAFQPSQERRRR
jgi:GcrA cell cycle regulator